MKPADVASPNFSPGFRFSRLDAIVLLLGGLGAAGVSRVDPKLALAVAFVIAHFFLFCNVIRMSRPLELMWAGSFAALVVCCVVFELISWTLVFTVAAAITMLLVFIQARLPSYHGVAWRIVNPNLPEWWATRPNGAQECSHG